MRVAALADVHGNLPALEAVLSEVDAERPDLVVFCGDVASGPMPAETIEMLRAVANARFVRGNADRGLVDEYDGKDASPMPGPFAGWCAKQIDKEQRDYLAAFEDTVTLDGVDGIGRVLFCHAVPRNDTDVMTSETSLERMRTLLSGVDADLVVCGHTHIQFDRTVDRIRVVNAGSVGMPYGEPGAYWAMLGPNVRVRRTNYDLEAAAVRIRAKGSADAEQFARDNVLKVPTLEEAMTFMRAMDARQIAAGLSQPAG
jgi:putative phosphoesterase